MQTVTIGPNDAGQRVDKFLQKNYQNLPVSMMYKAIRQKDIKLNGRRCQISDRLREGDVLTLYVRDEFLEKTPPVYDFLSASRRLDIVYEDANLLLLDKKAGLLVHPDAGEYGDTLIGRVQRYLYEKGEYDPEREQAFAPALVNRIDRNTSGIVIAAKTAEALRILNQKIKGREIDKRYLCIVHGTPKPAAGTLEGYLFKDAVKNRVYVTKTPQKGAKTCATKYQVLQSRNGLSLVECELITGRTHQIRAQMAAAGWPLLGDGKYGKLDKQYDRKIQALYSYKLTFQFTTDAGGLAYLNGKTFQVSDVSFVSEYFS